MLGSLFAGLAFSNAILGNVHAMAHSLGGFLDLPHGLCNAVLLDYVVEYNFEAAPQRYLDLAAAMGEKIGADCSLDRQKKQIVAAIRRLKHKLGVDDSLQDIGVHPDDIPELAAKALQDACLLTNPRKTGLSDLIAIFNAAMVGYE
jgi:alcohol dehydrogenase class IV